MAFDVSSILNTIYNSALSTEYKVVPEGDWEAQIIDLRTRIANTKVGDRVILEAVWEVLSDEASEATGRPHPTVRQSIFLDTIEKDGAVSLDSREGSNVPLGRLRAALHQNDPDRPWHPEELKGVPAIVTVSHRSDGDRTYADVSRVSPLG